jgi:predicted negative regulator of RcsB-dependent stress response
VKLGEAYLVRGDKDKAIENYQRALAIDPTMESAKQALKNAFTAFSATS